MQQWLCTAASHHCTTQAPLHFCYEVHSSVIGSCVKVVGTISYTFILVIMPRCSAYTCVFAARCLEDTLKHVSSSAAAVRSRTTVRTGLLVRFSMVRSVVLMSARTG